MSDTGGRPELRICVIGAFRVLAHDRQELTPGGRKARALLAILALTPTRRRSRSALQDKLWSDRGPEQGAASLRQTLSEIRRAFGERYRDCLVSDLRGIGLASDRVTVDLDTDDLSVFASAIEAPVLLEDIDVADEEFEHWLRNQRVGFEQRIASSKRGVAALSSEPGVAVHTSSAPVRPWIRILAPSATSSESGLFLSRLVGDRIAQGLVDQWGIEVRDDREGPQGARLRVDALPMSREVAVNVALFSADGALQLWSGSGAISLENGFVSDEPRLQTLINQSVDVAAQYLDRTRSSPEACFAFGQAFEAVQRMLKVELAEVDRADASGTRTWARPSWSSASVKQATAKRAEGWSCPVRRHTGICCTRHTAWPRWRPVGLTRRCGRPRLSTRWSRSFARRGVTWCRFTCGSANATKRGMPLKRCPSSSRPSRSKPCARPPIPAISFVRPAC
jgi:hypothetical protein